MPRPTKDLKQLARAHTSAAIKTLIGIMNQPKAPAAARIAASNSILERGWGKSVQPHAGEDGEGPVEIKVIETIIVDPKNQGR